MRASFAPNQRNAHDPASDTPTSARKPSRPTPSIGPALLRLHIFCFANPALYCRKILADWLVIGLIPFVENVLHCIDNAAESVKRAFINIYACQIGRAHV